MQDGGSYESRRQLFRSDSAIRQLQVVLVLFAVLLAVPTVWLIRQVSEKFENESFYRYQQGADDVVRAINATLESLVRRESTRPFDDYTFSRNVPLANDEGVRVEMSPLAEYPVGKSVPGLVGYFQVDPDGTLRSPLVPSGLPGEPDPILLGVAPEELAARLRSYDTLASELVQGGFGRPLGAAAGSAATPEAPPLSNSAHPADKKALKAEEIADLVVRNRVDSQVAQERLLEDGSLPTGLEQNIPVSKLNLDSKLLEKQRREFRPAKDLQGAEQRDKVPARSASDQAAPERAAPGGATPTEPAKGGPGALTAPRVGETDLLGAENRAATPGSPVRILSLDGETDPLLFRFLGDQRLLMMRKLWRDGRRYIQGFALDSTAFFDEVVDQRFRSSPLAGWSTMIIGYRGVFFRRVQSATAASARSADAREIVLARSSLVPPFDAVEILIAAPKLPESPGWNIVVGMGLGTGLIVGVGLWSIYRLGRRQILLAKERSDFVSAVSHELKTPLTSIRMYGDMLRSGWVEDEEKRRSYYDYIVSESERLSRLIGNVLHLSQLTRGDARLEVRPVKVVDLLKLAQQKAQSLVETADFTLRVESAFEHGDEVRREPWVRIEEDAFSRIVINLVDNALKFSKQAERKEVVLSLRVGPGAEPRVVFAVRDFGVGVPREEMKNIFRLFYRGEDELRRSTPGTGIGLALVQELAGRMNASVELRNVDPGAEFWVVFPGFYQESEPSRSEPPR